MEWIASGDNFRKLHAVDGLGSHRIPRFSRHGDCNRRFQRCNIDRRDIHNWSSGSCDYLDHPSFGYRRRCGLHTHAQRHRIRSAVECGVRAATTRRRYLTSTFVSATQLTAFVPASLIDSPGGCISSPIVPKEPEKPYSNFYRHNQSRRKALDPHHFAAAAWYGRCSLFSGIICHRWSSSLRELDSHKRIASARNVPE